MRAFAFGSHVGAASMGFRVGGAERAKVIETSQNRGM